MSAEFNDSNDSLTQARLAGAKTICYWWKITTDRNDFSAAFEADANAIVQTDGDGVTVNVWNGNTYVSGNHTHTVGTWYHHAFTIEGDSSGDDLRLLINGVQQCSGTRDGGSSGSDFYVGNDSFFEWSISRVAYFRAWNVILSDVEIAAEMDSTTPVRTSGLWMDTPFAADFDDDSGNGRHWTENGDVTINADMPDIGGGGGEITAVLDTTDATDTLSSTVTVAITASASLTEANDTLSSAATVAIAASASITEPADTLSAAGTVAITASASITDANDSLSSAGTVMIVAALSVTDATDTLSSAGAVAIVATLDVTEPADTLSSTATTQDGITATANLIEPDDSLDASVTVLVIASASLVEPADTLTSGATVGIVGSAQVIDPLDTLVSAGQVAIIANASLIEPDDTLLAIATFQQAAGRVTARFTTKQPGAAFSKREPAITFTTKQPGISFTED